MSKKETLWISPSRLEALELCPFNSENRKFTETPETIRGTRFHSIASEILLGDEPDISKDNDWVKEMVEKWMGFSLIQDLLLNPGKILLVDGENHILCDEVHGKQFLHIPLNKGEKNGLRGYPDLISKDGDTLIVWDWKTGRNEPGQSQIRAYAWMGLELFPEYDKVIGRYFMTTTGEVFEYAFSREDLKNLPRSIVAIQNKYQTVPRETLPRTLNKYCGFCEFRDSCPETKQIAVDLPWKLARVPESEQDFEGVVTLLEKIKIGIKLLGSLKDMAEENRNRAIKNAGGAFRGSEKEWKLREIPSNSYDYPVPEVIEIALENEVSLNFLSVSLSGFEKAVKGLPHAKELTEKVKKLRISTGTREIVEEVYLGPKEIEPPTQNEKEHEITVIDEISIPASLPENQKLEKKEEEPKKITLVDELGRIYQEISCLEDLHFRKTNNPNQKLNEFFAERTKLEKGSGVSMYLAPPEEMKRLIYLGNSILEALEKTEINEGKNDFERILPTKNPKSDAILDYSLLKERAEKVLGKKIWVETVKEFFPDLENVSRGLDRKVLEKTVDTIVEFTKLATDKIDKVIKNLHEGTQKNENTNT